MEFMTSYQLKKQADKIKETAKKAMASEESARKFLISTGAYTKTGRLKKAFK